MGMSVAEGWQSCVRSTLDRRLAAIPALPVMAVAGGGRERLSLVWERDLGQFIREVPGANSHTHSVFDLKISDDDRWIGVDLVADRTSVFTNQHHHLLVVPLEWTGNGLEQFEVEQFEFQHSGGTEKEFFLSADGNLVIMEDGRGIRLEDRRQHSSCSVSPDDNRQYIFAGGFINPELFLATRSYPDPYGTARYELYDQNCKPVDHWELSGGVPATTWPGGQVLVGRYLGRAWETLLVEWPSWKTVQRWPLGRGGLAADQGRAVCGMFFSDRFECRDTATNAPLAKPPVVHTVVRWRFLNPERLPSPLTGLPFGSHLRRVITGPM